MGLNYAWVFPMGNDVANVGVVTSVRQSRFWHLNLRETMLRFLREQPGVRERCTSARQASQFRAAPIRAGLTGSPACADGILFAGDAAATADPLSAEGIRQAIESGRLAAEIAQDALAHGDASAVRLRAYERRLHALHGEEYQRQIDTVRGNVRLYRALYPLFSRL
jgi:flavin-dependent dehydrogenase